MAVTIVSLGTTLNTNVGDKTLTVTPAVGDIIVVVAIATGVATSAASDNNADGDGAAYTAQTSDYTGFSTAGHLSIWTRDNLVGSATSTVFTVSQGSSTGGGLQVYAIRGMVGFSVDKVGGVSSGTAGVAPYATFSSAPASTSAVVMGCGNGAGTPNLTPPTNYTEDIDTGYSIPTTGFECIHRNSGETNQTVTWGNTSATVWATACIAIAEDTSTHLTLSAVAAQASVSAAIATKQPLPLSASAAQASASLTLKAGVTPIAKVIREFAPLRLDTEVTLPGLSFRWAQDDKTQNVPNNLTFSTTVNGGFDTWSCALARQPQINYSDLDEFATLTTRAAGGQIVWQGRIELTPRASGNEISISPSAVGWQAHLDDNQAVRALYVNRAFADWQGPSVQRQLNILAGAWQNDGSASVSTDQSTGAPSLVDSADTSMFAQGCEGIFDAKGLILDSLYYAWKTSFGSINNTTWFANAYLMNNDVFGASDSVNLSGVGPGSGTLTATTLTRKWAAVSLWYSSAGGTPPAVAGLLYWTCLALYGKTGLTKRGTGTYTSAPGFYASDIIEHAITKWAPKLKTSRGGFTTIAPTKFIVPHASYLDKTTVSNIIKDVLKYEILDWWVDEYLTFNLAAPNDHGRRWCARVGPSGLSEVGPQVDRMVNKVMVEYTDVSGKTRTAGPIGSGADTEDISLTDPNPDNPVTKAGLVRYPPTIPNVGLSTPAGAVRIAQGWLYELLQATNSGQATIAGYVEDDKGVVWPASFMRGGDQITFTDAHDTSYRRIVKTNYTDNSKVCQIDLDSPPQGLEAALARFAMAIQNM